MESEPLQPQTSPERVASRANEQGEKILRANPETGNETGAEKFEQRSESGARVSDNTPILPPPIQINPATQGVPSDTADTVVSDMPLIANDDDLIEKEWVDKAKKIIIETKDNPYRREEAVGQLQRDYLEKRYGRQIGSNDDSV